MTLPGGGPVEIAFGPQCRLLGQSVRVVWADYVASPGSVMAQDYRCAVQVDDSGRRRAGEISLNHPLRVGAYELSQGSWMPSGPNVRQIVLGVSSRPGLWLVYLGMILVSAGFPWAFWIKPMLLKRSQDSAQLESEQPGQTTAPASPDNAGGAT